MRKIEKSGFQVKTTVRDFLAGQLSEKTKASYRADLRQFAAFVKGKPLQEIGPQDGIRYRNWLEEKGYAKSTINRKLSALRSLFDFLVAAGSLKLNPFHPKLVKGFKSPRQFAPSTLSRTELKALLAACDKKGRGKYKPIVGLRDRIIILLGFVELLRRGEVAGLRAGDIKTKLGHWVLELRRTKSGAVQWVKLRSDVKSLIDEYLEIIEKAYGKPLPDEAPLLHSFSNRNFLGPLSSSAVDKIFRERLRQAGINPRKRGLSFHSLRHTGITAAKDAGADITAVQLAARHSDPKTTMRYYHSDKWLRDSAVDKIEVPG